MKYHEVIVIGGGLAGLRAAIEVNQCSHKVAVISRVHPLRSHSIAAQGGINAPLGNHPRGGQDSPEKHAFDTVRGSDYLADQNAVMLMTREATQRIVELEHWGCPFSRTADGLIAQRPFGGTGFPRACYASDKTGHMVLHTLYEQAMRFLDAAEREEMVFYDEWLVTALVDDGERCLGVIGLNLTTGELEAFAADAVIIATGGSGRLYNNTTNALINTGGGMAIAYWAGVPLKDMEFVQFHPTTLFGSNILMTEGCRGEGGYLLNNKGERFLANYPDSRKAMEVAPRDIVARNMMREILEGRGFQNAYLHLDLRHLGAERIMTRLPGIRDICMNFLGIDPITDFIPVQPGQHYSMGGIDCDLNAATAMKGLYAAGEAACVSVHGANRLGGNSLLETVVFGAVAGAKAAEFAAGATSPANRDALLGDALKREQEKVEGLLNAKGDINPAEIKENLTSIMALCAGIFREGESLKFALERIKELKEQYKRIRLNYTRKKLNQELMWTLELKGSLDLAEAVVAGALAREESRGSQFRTDFPQRDDARWLKHTLASYMPDGPVLSYKPVTLGYFEPKERKY